MAIPVDHYPPEKYLGNRKHKEVHDLENEKSLCQIREIIDAGNAVVFTPDILKQAHKEGYDNCAFCIGCSER